MNALGLIEVIGFPCAVDAADAAAKSASVRVLGISKIGSGILTVQLSGDVGAIQSAVAAGAASAAKVGKVLYTHVIPRADNQLLEKKVVAALPTTASASSPKSTVKSKEEQIDKSK